MNEEARDRESAEPDPLEIDYYVVRLAAMSSQLAVVATQDIVNASGELVVPLGTPIDAAVAERIVGDQADPARQLAWPIEFQVGLHPLVTGQDLLHASHTLFARFPDLRALQEGAFDERLLAELTDQALGSEVIAQKLTLLRYQLPERFEEALFCGWLTAVIARERGCETAVLHQAYLAGLTRDLGFLHIPPRVLDKKGRLGPAEWQAIQRHVEYSASTLSVLPEVPLEVMQAVSEHHERCDGSGYPHGLQGDDISPLGRLTGLADTLQAIRFKQFGDSGRTLYDLIPYLQLNGHAHGQAEANAAITALRKTGLKTTSINPCGTLTEFVGEILKQIQAINRQFKSIQDIARALARHRVGEAGRRLLERTQQVEALITTSGLTRPELVRWLGSLLGTTDTGVLGELNETDLMLRELQWQVKNLIRHIDQYHDQAESEADQAASRDTRAHRDALHRAVEGGG